MLSDCCPLSEGISCPVPGTLRAHRHLVTLSLVSAASPPPPHLTEDLESGQSHTIASPALVVTKGWMKAAEPDLAMSPAGCLAGQAEVHSPRVNPALGTHHGWAPGIAGALRL